jgi:hypothetical protein
MGDDLMELRSMILLEFGCPPLPIADGQRMETGEQTVINSHDLLSVFMVQAFKKKDTQLNASRKETQSRIEQDYHEGLAQSDSSFESVYGLMAEYTRQYLATFLLSPFTINDVRILPPEYVSPQLLDEIKDYVQALKILNDTVANDRRPEDIRECFLTCHGILCNRNAASLRNPTSTEPHSHLPANDSQNPQTAADAIPIDPLDDTT